MPRLSFLASCLLFVLTGHAITALASTTTDATLKQCIDAQAELIAEKHPSQRKRIEEVTSYFQSEGEYHVAIVGPSGAGKSTLLNTLIGKKNTDPGASPVCHGQECTGKDAGGAWNKEGFQSMFNPRVRYFDLPGGTTKKYSTDDFIKTFNLTLEVEAKGFKRSWYQAVILVASSRVLEFNVKLYNALRKKGIPVFIVYNKINHDIENCEIDYLDSKTTTDNFCHDSQSHKVRVEVRKQYLLDTEQKVFLIDARKPAEHDFALFTEHMYSSLCLIAMKKMLVQLHQFQLSCDLLCKVPKPSWSMRAMMAGAAGMAGMLIATPVVAPALAPYFAGVGLKILADGTAVAVSLSGAAAYSSGLASIGAWFGGGMVAGGTAISVETAVTGASITLAATSANQIMCDCPDPMTP
jgi:GTP-binding protein EngB required for normal cell division